MTDHNYQQQFRRYFSRRAERPVSATSNQRPRRTLHVYVAITM